MQVLWGKDRGYMDGMKKVLSYKFRVPRFKTKHVVYGMVLILALSMTAYTEEPLLKVRKPVFAGSFYPADRNILDKTIDSYLKEVESKSERLPFHIFGIIAPHAGYEYSGRVASFAYYQVKGKEYRTVILMGPTHRVAFRGISICPSGLWETPLGGIEIDQEVAKTLIDHCKAVKVFPLAFEREHSLEVQLPFLQKALKTFKVVPLVMGSMEENDYKTLSDALFKVLKQNPKNILIIASSDMSHFHSYSKANQMDNLALKDIEALNLEKLEGDLFNGECELCGAQAVITLMMTAQKLNAGVKILQHANSGDVTKDTSSVVGYGAVAFYYAKDAHSLNKKEQKTLLTIARNVLEEYIAKGSIPKLEVQDKRLLEKRGAFVTLTKQGNLRGCIGYIAPMLPLYKAVSDMTVAASTRDMRFPPVTKEELKDIHIEVSVLSPLKLINNISEIEVGKHGLYISRGDYAGLLLPQVATQYLWNREEFLRQTCLKAGLPPNTWKEKGTQIYIFSTQIFSE